MTCILIKERPFKKPVIDCAKCNGRVPDEDLFETFPMKIRGLYRVMVRWICRECMKIELSPLKTITKKEFQTLTKKKK